MLLCSQMPTSMTGVIGVPHFHTTAPLCITAWDKCCINSIVLKPTHPLFCSLLRVLRPFAHCLIVTFLLWCVGLLGVCLLLFCWLFGGCRTCTARGCIILVHSVYCDCVVVLRLHCDSIIMTLCCHDSFVCIVHSWRELWLLDHGRHCRVHLWWRRACAAVGNGCDCVAILGQHHDSIIMTLCCCGKWEWWLLERAYAMSHFSWVQWSWWQGRQCTVVYAISW